MIDTESHPRKPWLAVVLALLCPGLGHVYGGRLIRGILFFLVPFGAALVVTILSFVPPSRGVLWAIVCVMVAPVLIHLVSIVDAFFVARRGRKGYTLFAYNSLPIYLVLLFLGVTLPLMGPMLLRAFVFEAFKLPTQSMQPTLLRGDRILVNKHAYRGKDVERGDVVVFRHPSGSNVHFVKRVSAVEGDHVYVLGDNQDNSRDSRHFGTIPSADVVGKAVYVFLPAESWDRFGPIR